MERFKVYTNKNTFLYFFGNKPSSSIVCGHDTLRFYSWLGRQCAKICKIDRFLSLYNTNWCSSRYQWPAKEKNFIIESASANAVVKDRLTDFEKKEIQQENGGGQNLKYICCIWIFPLSWFFYNLQEKKAGITIWFSIFLYYLI